MTQARLSALSLLSIENEVVEGIDFEDIVALLVHCLGTEGQRIFRTLGQAKKYREATKILEAHFAVPQMVILRRIIFRQRRQKAGESVQHYIADLRSLAVFCKFGEMEQEMIRDQLAEHAAHPKIREKLIMSPDDLTLKKALEIALQIEKATELTSQLASRASSQPALTQHVEDSERSPSPASSDTDPGINYTSHTRSQPRLWQLWILFPHEQSPNMPGQGKSLPVLRERQPLRQSLSLCAVRARPTDRPTTGCG
uniref:Retrotransposon gag domain-containing protein n=1 Tax=Gadus morhua TaxID=8049 RepID=A0A8C5ADR8_GADMO